MPSHRGKQLSIEIDELTNSIKEVSTGRVLPTEVVRLLSVHAAQVHKKDWSFNWHLELLEPTREVYKLAISEEPGVIQGLISLEDQTDHVFTHLLESAKHNRGRTKRFAGVPGNLLAFACQVSFDKGYAGFVSFVAKHVLVQHYITTLGAQVLRGNRMYLDTHAGTMLVERYFTKSRNGPHRTTGGS